MKKKELIKELRGVITSLFNDIASLQTKLDFAKECNKSQAETIRCLVEELKRLQTETLDKEADND